MQTRETITLDVKAQQRLLVLAHVLAGELDVGEAAAYLRLSVRQVRRLCERLRAEGAAGGAAPAQVLAEAPVDGRLLPLVQVVRPAPQRVAGRMLAADPVALDVGAGGYGGRVETAVLGVVPIADRPRDVRRNLVRQRDGLARAALDPRDHHAFRAMSRCSMIALRTTGSPSGERLWWTQWFRISAGDCDTRRSPPRPRSTPAISRPPGWSTGRTTPNGGGTPTRCRTPTTAAALRAPRRSQVDSPTVSDAQEPVGCRESTTRSLSTLLSGFLDRADRSPTTDHSRIGKVVCGLSSVVRILVRIPDHLSQTTEDVVCSLYLVTSTGVGHGTQFAGGGVERITPPRRRHGPPATRDGVSSTGPAQ